MAGGSGEALRATLAVAARLAASPRTTGRTRLGRDLAVNGMVFLGPTELGVPKELFDGPLLPGAAARCMVTRIVTA